jgi:hypothetical protein
MTLLEKPPTFLHHVQNRAPCQYIRGQSSAVSKRDQSIDAEFVSRRFAGSSICDDIEIDLLPLVEGAQPGTLDRTDMNKDVLAAVGRFNKAKAFLAVEPLYSARTHENFLSLAVHTRALAREASLPFPTLFDFGKMPETCAPVTAGEAAQSFGQLST